MDNITSLHFAITFVLLLFLIMAVVVIHLMNKQRKSLETTLANLITSRDTWKKEAIEYAKDINTLRTTKCTNDSIDLNYLYFKTPENSVARNVTSVPITDNKGNVIGIESFIRRRKKEEKGYERVPVTLTCLKGKERMLLAKK